MPPWLQAAAGAALGATARWALALMIPGMLGLAVTNLCGCYLMGRYKPGPFAGTGVLGGFTSFASYIALSTQADAPTGITYFIATIVLCLGGWAAGDALHARMTRNRTEHEPRS
ncbi:fluoride ion transporter CrcB [Corynebacterium sp. 13CS0277]|nr:fluoride ion transporter CrcB [Corynebacterium sp. 13CS0277]